MNILPGPGIVYLKPFSPKAGVLDVSSKPAAKECGEVVAVGEGVKDVKAGDIIFFKAWAVDIVQHEGEEYKFINTQTGGILATIRG